MLRCGVDLGHALTTGAYNLNEKTIRSLHVKANCPDDPRADRMTGLRIQMTHNLRLP